MDEGLDGQEQDYLVCPDQPWLDGINAGNGYIRQFVAMPLGMGYTVEGQVTGKEESGGIQLEVFQPKPGMFPKRPPFSEGDGKYCLSQPLCDAEMGLAAGGKMEQKIYPDEYGIDTWDQENSDRLYVHIVNSMVFREITGLEPPPTPITTKQYTDHGLPWFELYDEGRGDVEPSDTLAGVKSTSEVDAEKGFGPQQEDKPVEVSEQQVIGLKGATPSPSGHGGSESGQPS